LGIEAYRWQVRPASLQVPGATPGSGPTAEEGKDMNTTWLALIAFNIWTIVMVLVLAFIHGGTKDNE
jgi:hypothetical protein